MVDIMAKSPGERYLVNHHERQTLLSPLPAVAITIPCGRNLVTLVRSNYAVCN